MAVEVGADMTALTLAIIAEAGFGQKFGVARGEAEGDGARGAAVVNDCP
jgi:hypothetical protein